MKSGRTNTTEKKRGSFGKVIKWILITLFMLVFLVVTTVLIVHRIGKYNIAKKSKADTQILENNETLEDYEAEEWEPGWVKYNGKTYEYNEDIMTFLFMGIDKDSDAVEGEDATDGGQADAIFLAVANPHKKEIKVISINRNAMTDIDVYDEAGNYIGTVEAQLTVQHGFGDGLEQSCEYQVDAVRRLMYNIPITGYVAINMGAISTINDSIGGVDLVALEDVKDGETYEILMYGGDYVHLMGNNAYWYVRDRNENVFGTSDDRLARQKQYIEAFVAKLKNVAKDNIGIVLDIYNAISTQMVTDITSDEITYLVPEFLGYSFDSSDILTTKGETVMGEYFEEFYVDEDALYEMILDVFYEEVK